jgi:hypothetical protein
MIEGLFAPTDLLILCGIQVFPVDGATAEGARAS